MAGQSSCIDGGGGRGVIRVRGGMTGQLWSEGESRV